MEDCRITHKGKEVPDGQVLELENLHLCTTALRQMVNLRHLEASLEKRGPGQGNGEAGQKAEMLHDVLRKI